MAKTTTESTKGASEEPVNENGSRRERFIERMERMDDFNVNVAKAGQKFTKAIESGFSVYLENREESGKERREDVVRDEWVNLAKGVSAGLSAGGEALIDLADAFSSMGPTEEQRNRMADRFERFPMFPFFC